MRLKLLKKNLNLHFNRLEKCITNIELKDDTTRHGRERTQNTRACRKGTFCLSRGRLLSQGDTISCHAIHTLFPIKIYIKLIYSVLPHHLPPSLPPSLKAAKSLRRRVEKTKQKLSGMNVDEEFQEHRDNFEQQQVLVIVVFFLFFFITVVVREVVLVTIEAEMGSG